MSTSLRTYRERVVSLGSEAALVGIATDPNDEHEHIVSSAATRPSIIFLNAGVLHRVGPHRLHVSMARQLAGSGFRSVRLDLSGIGDSRNVPGNLSFRASSVADTRVVMDEMKPDDGSGRFVLFGLCSGADNALAVAQSDSRVVGLVLIDGPVYTTNRARIRMVLERLRQQSGIGARVRWALRVLARKSRLGAALTGTRLGVSRTAMRKDGSSSRLLPSRTEYEELLTRLLDRGVSIFCIYSGVNGENYNQRDQLFEAFPALRGRVEVAYFPTANHVFTELARRGELIASVTRWIEARFA